MGVSKRLRDVLYVQEIITIGKTQQNIYNFKASGDKFKNKYPSGKSPLDFKTGDIYFHCFRSKKLQRGR